MVSCRLSGMFSRELSIDVAIADFRAVGVMSLQYNDSSLYLIKIHWMWSQKIVGFTSDLVVQPFQYFYGKEHFSLEFLWILMYGSTKIYVTLLNHIVYSFLTALLSIFSHYFR